MSNRPTAPPAPPSEPATAAVVQDVPAPSPGVDVEALRGSLVARMHRDEANLLYVMQQAREHANWGLMLQADTALRRLHELEARVTGVLTVAPTVTTNVAIVTDSPREEIARRLDVLRERHLNATRALAPTVRTSESDPTCILPNCTD